MYIYCGHWYSCSINISAKYLIMELLNLLHEYVYMWSQRKEMWLLRCVVQIYTYYTNMLKAIFLLPL